MGNDFRYSKNFKIFIGIALEVHNLDKNGEKLNELIIRLNHSGFI